MKNSGRCHKAQIPPRIKLETRAENLSCNLGKAYPLHPNSSKMTAKMFSPSVDSIKTGSVKKLTKLSKCLDLSPIITASNIASRVAAIATIKITENHLIPTLLKL